MTQTQLEALFDLEPDWAAVRWTVREAPTTGRDWAIRYHYAQRVPAGSVAYGVFCPDMVASVFVGTSVGNVSGVAAKLGLEVWSGNLEITRVICHPDAPKNTASRAIAAVLRYVHRARGVDWVFSYADTGQNHHGGIYQALNAVYVGVNGAARHGYLLDGRGHFRHRGVAQGARTSRTPRHDLGEGRGRLHPEALLRAAVCNSCCEPPHPQGFDRPRATISASRPHLVTATSVNHIRTGHKVTCKHCAHQAIYRDVRPAVRDYQDHKCPAPREGAPT
jgi:hypothetical protein